MDHEKGYGIFMSDTSTLFFEIENIQRLYKHLEALDSFLRVPIMNQTKIDRFQSTAHQLFQTLFPFDQAVNLMADKQLIIIPDQRLSKIPFEVLIPELKKDLSDAYLIQYCDIGYLHSASFFMQQQEHNPSNNYLFFAPESFVDTTLSSLQKNHALTQFIDQQGRSTKCLGAKATKKNFLHHLSDYSIVHINTHAGLDSIDMKPWLAFHDQIMHWDELFGKENQAELIVLDACKTNDGLLMKGEGILNLSRSFFYNGTASVLASSWNVNERSGNQILTDFYKYLDEGRTKTKALQGAKINFLQSDQYARALPYYWAPFTLTGNPDGILLKPAKSIWRKWIFIIAGSILLYIFISLFKSSFPISR